MDEKTGSIKAIDYIRLTESLVSAYIANNSVPALEMTTLIASTHAALIALGKTDVSASAVKKATPSQILKSMPVPSWPWPSRA